jgi:hypothetical protein
VALSRENPDPVAAFSTPEDVHNLAAPSPRVTHRPKQHPIAGLGPSSTLHAPGPAGVVSHEARRTEARARVDRSPSDASRGRLAWALVDPLHEAVIAWESVATAYALEFSFAQESLEDGPQAARHRAAATERPQQCLLAKSGTGTASECLKNRFACEDHPQ